MTKRIQISALTYVRTYVFYNGQIFLSSVYTHTLNACMQKLFAYLEKFVYISSFNKLDLHGNLHDWNDEIETK